VRERVPKARHVGRHLLQLAKFGGMTVSEAKRLKALEDEKLKKLLAEQMLDLSAMKDLVARKW